MRSFGMRVSYCVIILRAAEAKFDLESCAPRQMLSKYLPARDKPVLAIEAVQSGESHKSATTLTTESAGRQAHRSSQVINLPYLSRKRSCRLDAASPKPAKPLSSRLEFIEIN